jgi:hypothetical protein
MEMEKVVVVDPIEHNYSSRTSIYRYYTRGDVKLK